MTFSNDPGIYRFSATTLSKKTFCDKVSKSGDTFFPASIITHVISLFCSYGSESSPIDELSEICQSTVSNLFLYRSLLTHGY